MSEKIVFRYFGKKTIIFRQKIEVLTRAKKWTFFKGVCPWILSKFRTFCHRRFLQKSYQKRSFLILWKEKNDFKVEKIEVLKRAKKWAFSIGVSPWILSKNRNLFYGCFSQNSCQK